MWILLVQLSKQDHNKNLGSASLSPSAQIRSSTFGTNSLAHAALVLYGFVAWKAGPDGLLDASLSVGLKFPPRSLPKSLMSRSKSTASPRIDSLLPIYPAYLGSRIRCQWIPLSLVASTDGDAARIAQLLRETPGAVSDRTICSGKTPLLVRPQYRVNQFF